MNLSRIRTPEYALFFCRVPNELDIFLGRDYIVEFDYGLDHAEVIEFGDLLNKYKETKIPGFRIIRLVGDQDRQFIEENQRLADKLRLDLMKQLEIKRIATKLVHVRVSFDQRRAFIRYFSKAPINLQESVEPLAKLYRISFNLWQVGLRDDARLIGCIGHCGREACCCSWMKQEYPVNLRMAKNQGIPLNPSSLNGTCSRLKCCLRFENEIYEQAAAKLPRLGATVICRSHDDFKGVIINRDILQARLVLKSQDGRFLTVDASDAELK